MSSGPANGRSDSTSTPGTACGGGDQAVGQPVAGQLDDDVVDGDAVAALEDVEGHDVDAGVPSAVATAPRMPGRSGTTRRRR